MIGGSPSVKRHITKNQGILSQSSRCPSSSVPQIIVSYVVRSATTFPRQKEKDNSLFDYCNSHSAETWLHDWLFNIFYFQLEISLSVTVNMAAFDKADQQPGKTTVVSTQFNCLVVTCLDVLKVELMGRKCKGGGFNSA